MLLASSLLWVLSVVLNFVGSGGLLTAGWFAWAAMATDIPGVLVLAWIYFALARHAMDRAQMRRRGIAWALVLWSALTVYWRFLLPLGSGTNVEDLFQGLLGAFPAGLALAQASPLLVQELFAVWTAAALIFAGAHALIALDYRRAGRDEWVKGLPAYAWLMAAAVSLAGTALVVYGLLVVLGGGEIMSSVTAGAVLKLLVAPNLFLSGYVASLQLGLTVVRMERRAAAI